MSEQNQQSSVMRIAPSDKTETGSGTASCSSPTIDLRAAYRTSRLASQYSLSSMRGLSAGVRSGSVGYFRRAA